MVPVSPVFSNTRSICYNLRWQPSRVPDQRQLSQFLEILTFQPTLDKDGMGGLDASPRLVEA
jgi:hypothetical protein